MKTRLLLTSILALLLLSSSCRTYQKLMETGQYDKLIEKAVHKLRGKKKKKTEWVMALEVAFDRANKRDINTLENLNAKTFPDRWEKAYRVLSQIERRQDLVSPLVPLRDKNGQRARFDFISVHDLLEEAKTGAAQHLYAKSASLLDRARNGDRLAAREALTHLQDIGKYRKWYRDTERLKDIAWELGRTDILVTVENHSNSILPAWLEEKVKHISSGDERRWRRIVTDHLDSELAEYTAKIVLYEMEVSPEQWRETIHHLNEEIEEIGYLRNSEGNYMLDSLGKKIEIVTKFNVRATVTELTQEKGSYIKGDVIVTDNVDGGIVLRRPFNGQFSFVNRAISYQGDERALGDFARQLGQPVAFPDDATMLEQAAAQIEPQVTRMLLRSKELY